MQGELIQNADRYSLIGDEYQIQASSSIAPLKIVPIEIGDSRELDGKLSPTINSLIVHIEDTNTYLSSPDLISTLEEVSNTNPHFGFRELSSIMGAKMGKTIPIIKITTKTILKEIEKQNLKVKNAGVKSIEWPVNLGNPEVISGLIKQINWTLSPSDEKPLDTFTIWDIQSSLTGDYSITPLTIEPLDENAKIPEEKLAANLEIISKRLSDLRVDFNKIKKLFYFGESEFTIPQRITMLSTADDEMGLEVQVVTKTSDITRVESTPSNKAIDVQTAKVEEVSTTLDTKTESLTNKITQTEATIKSAQSGDAAAQKALADTASTLKAQLKALQDKFTNTTPTN